MTSDTSKHWVRFQVSGCRKETQEIWAKKLTARCWFSSLLITLSTESPPEARIVCIHLAKPLMPPQTGLAATISAVFSFGLFDGWG